MKVSFIACGKRKQAGRAKARDLYTGALFKKCLSYSEKNFDRVFILSAKYGLLDLDSPVEYYELSLNSLRARELEEWARRVMVRLSGEITAGDDLYFFTGERYRRHLMRWLPNNKSAPMKGLSIGKQLRWLKERT